MRDFIYHNKIKRFGLCNNEWFVVFLSNILNAGNSYQKHLFKSVFELLLLRRKCLVEIQIRCIYMYVSALKHNYENNSNHLINCFIYKKKSMI